MSALLIARFTRERIALGFVTCLRNRHHLPSEKPALTRSGTANGFWRSPRRRSPGRAQIPAWTTSPKRLVSGRARCIATFLRAKNFYRRFIGLSWKR